MRIVSLIRIVQTQHLHKMKNKFLMILLAGFSFTACGQDFQIKTKTASVEKIQKIASQHLNAKEDNFLIEDYFTTNTNIDSKVISWMSNMSDEDKVAQLIMPAMGRLGQSEETIMKLVEEKKIGGILMLNGTKEQFTSWISKINAKNNSLGATPFLYSADAEPTLFNRKITGTDVVKKASEILTENDARIVAQQISKELNAIGINYNFAPVSDMASNGTVGYRGFGKDPKNIVPFSQAFVEESQKANIMATIKHFPGHGLVSGDTHKSLQVINGELKELDNFKQLIAKNVPSVMIGHLAIENNEKYNTNGLPATVSPVILQTLLREELQFKGLIVTDAMNMGGVTQVPNVYVKSIEAGVDILLMPLDANKAHAEILKQYKSDDTFKKSVDEAVSRVIRMKVCMGLIK